MVDPSESLKEVQMPNIGTVMAIDKSGCLNFGDYF